MLRKALLFFLPAFAVCCSAASAETLTLICKCQRVVVNGEERGCRGQSDRIAVVDLDKQTLQWSNGVGQAWPPIEASISPDKIEAGLDPSKPRNIEGRLMISHYTISRITGEFEEDGFGHTRDPAAPRVDFIVPADVYGTCTKSDAPKF